MFSRRAEAMTFNVLIIAIIGLVVFLVIIAIFSQNSGKAVNTIEQCESRGAKCEPPPSCPIGTFQLPNIECPTSQICCLKLNS